MGKLRVLIADDHVIFRDGLRSLLTSTPEIELVGEAATGEAAVELANELQPDAIIMDIRMPGIGGIEATRRIRQVSPRIGILIVTMFEEDQLLFAALQAGVHGYLLKSVEHAEMLRAIFAVANGEAIFSPEIAGRLIKYFAELPFSTSPQIFPELSEREREILALIGRGFTIEEIADHLNLSSKTVRNHVTNILKKLQLADRAQAAIRAREAGLV